MAKKVQAKVTLSESDLEHILRMTGERKPGTAIQRVLLAWLDANGVETTTEDTRGGYRAQSPAYHAGYKWGKNARMMGVDVDVWEDGATVDSLADFEMWLESIGAVDPDGSIFEAWCRGTASGWKD